MVSRSQALTTLANETFDVLVIGGGVTGAGVAHDAVSRGYSVGLIEMSDYAAGTSSRSSKLVHGGLRYLQNFDLGLVREALLERQINVALAPHIVKPLPMLVPAFEGARPDRLMGLGLNMYDVMAVDRLRRRGRKGRSGKQESGAVGQSDWSPERHRTVTGEEVLELIPALADRSPTGGYLFYDCQTDDVRLVLTILAEAGRGGAVMANKVRALGLLEEEGRAAGVRVKDTLSGDEFEIRATNVVNATGVWADQLRPEELHKEADVPVIRPSRGTHILLPLSKVPVVGAAIAPAGGGRSIFIVPWQGVTLIGTTDNDYQGSLDHVKPAEDDIDYLLEATNKFFAMDLTSDDLVGAYAGVRPLISSSDPKKSVDISRKAELYETSSGLITITGGKLTTWRRMAKMTVDRLVERDGSEVPCRTHQIPLGMPIDPAKLTAPAGVDEESCAHLANRYGQAARDVLAIIREEKECSQRILPGYPDLLAEAVYAARHEQAQTVGDVLFRRTRLGLTAARELLGPRSDAPLRVARALRRERDWGPLRYRKEAEAFRDEARAEGVAVEATTSERVVGAKS